MLLSGTTFEEILLFPYNYNGIVQLELNKLLLKILSCRYNTGK